MAPRSPSPNLLLCIPPGQGDGGQRSQSGGFVVPWPCSPDPDCRAQTPLNHPRGWGKANGAQPHGLLARRGLNGAWGAIREENSHQPQSIFTAGAHYHFMESLEADKAAAFPTAARKSPGQTGPLFNRGTRLGPHRSTLHPLQSAASRVTHQPLNPLSNPLGDAGTFILRFPEPQVANRSMSARCAGRDTFCAPSGELKKEQDTLGC